MIKFNGSFQPILTVHLACRVTDLVREAGDERLVGVYGRAGNQTYYKRALVNNINFVIFDTAKGTTRTVGVSSSFSLAERSMS